MKLKRIKMMRANNWRIRLILCLVVIAALSAGTLAIAYAISAPETDAIEIKNCVYLPLTSVVKECGCGIKEYKTKLPDNGDEYLYVVSKKGDDIGSISISVVDEKIVTVMCDQDFSDLNNLMDAFLWGNEGIYVESERIFEAIG